MILSSLKALSQETLIQPIPITTQGYTSARQDGQRCGWEVPCSQQTKYQ